MGSDIAVLLLSIAFLLLLDKALSFEQIGAKLVPKYESRRPAGLILPALGSDRMLRLCPDRDQMLQRTARSPNFFALRNFIF